MVQPYTHHVKKFLYWQNYGVTLLPYMGSLSIGQKQRKQISVSQKKQISPKFTDLGVEVTNEKQVQITRTDLLDIDSAKADYMNSKLLKW